MNWWNQQIVVQEEAVEKVDCEQNLYVTHDSKPLVTLPYFPFIPWLGSVTRTVPIIIFETPLFLKIQTQSNCGNIGQENIAEDMVPPTLSEMGKDVLPGKFNDLVKQLPEMKNIEISNNKR